MGRSPRDASRQPPPTGADGLDLQRFDAPPDDHGLSLDDLGRAYAAWVGAGQDPYERPAIVEGPGPRPEDDDARRGTEGPPESRGDASDEEAERDAIDLPRDADSLAADASCDLTPRSILEAMLFVGHPKNEPLECRDVAALMRGVRPSEIPGLVEELNAQFADEKCPYQIVSIGSGYRLELRPEFARLRDRVLGRTHAARLSQTAIDVLAIVAYNQPMTREQVDEVRGRPSGGVLNQLVRRELLRIDRVVEDGRRRNRFVTTDRFLALYGLSRIDELPQGQDLDRPSDW
ncbi:MAG: SMC-Scp complex subunit ScpB [Planctomycetes bacterium]|nr:SMC-Scp complex subunit ScpB [Planctomycetota bacterium]